MILMSSLAALLIRSFAHPPMKGSITHNKLMPKMPQGALKAPSCHADRR